VRIRSSQLFIQKDYAKDNAESTTSSKYWQTKLNLPFVSYGGRLMLFWTVEGKAATKENVVIQVITNNTNIINENVISNTNPDEYVINTGFEFGNLPSGQQDVKLNYKSLTGKQVSVRNARLWLIEN